MPARPAEGTDDVFQDLLARARFGDEAAWVGLLNSIAGPVIGFFRLRDVADPEDLAGEVFAKVAGSINTFAGDERGFRSWTFTIARRLLIDEHRRRQRRPEVVGLDSAGRESSRKESSHGEVVSAEELVMDSFADTALLELLDQLTEDQRDVVILRIVGGFSIEETATIVDKNESAVKQLQRRGLAALRRALERSDSRGF